MTCATCGGEVPAAAKFCPACGGQVGTVCPACRHLNRRDSSYCIECGTGLGVPGRRSPPTSYTPRHLAERILATRSAIEGELKQVTILFCDLSDSTAIAERLGPERMHELLDRFFERAMNAVHKYEGTINQFLGDGFMALFGAPLALEDHTRRALFAAVDMRRALAEPPLLPDRNVAVRIGINSGSVVVGKIGDDLRTDYTAVGDVTNVAARLQQLAAPDDIVVSKSTRRLAGEWVRFEALGTFQLHGKSEPVEAYRVLGLGPRRSPLAGTADRSLTPFIGRERELHAIEDVLDSVQRGKGATLGIVGEPGIGKSRLIFEVRRALASRHVTYLESRCLPFSQSIPYSLVLDLLRANCGIVDSDTDDAIAAKVRFGLGELGLTGETRVDVLVALLGVKETVVSLRPEALKRRAFDTLRLMVLKGASRRPLVLVVEDLHWTDRTSEEFLVELAERVAEAAVLVLTTYRPGYSPPWLGRSNATQIALRALSPDDSAQLVAASAGTHDTATTAAIVARGEGNPFFLEELARAIRDVKGAGQQSVPDTVQGIIAARIDRLGEHPKRLLQIASVIGRDFAPALLEEVWDGPRPVDPLLRDLARRDFIYERLTNDEEQYTFRHALTLDVAYASLLERHRRAWHGAVGTALERLHPHSTTAIVETLAHHFALSDNNAKAVDYSIQAAEKAQRRWAHTEALAYFEAARPLLAQLPRSRDNALRQVDAVLKQGEIRFALGQHIEQLEALAGIRDVLEAEGDPARQAAWHYWTGFLHSLTGSRAEIAIDHCQQAINIARAHSIEGIEARAHSCLAQVSLMTGALRNGIDVGEMAIASFEASGDLWWAGRTFGHLAPIANALGDWDRAFAYGQRALLHATALEDQRLRITALLRMASTLIQRGEPAEGLRLCDEAMALDPGPFDTTAIRAIRGYGLVKAGALSEGTSLLENVREWLERSRLRYTHCQISLWLAEAYLQAGARDRACSVLEPALMSATTLGYRHLAGVTHRLLAETAASDDEAATHVERAIAYLREVGAENEAAKTSARWRR